MVHSSFLTDRTVVSCASVRNRARPPKVTPMSPRRRRPPEDTVAVVAVACLFAIGLFAAMWPQFIDPGRLLHDLIAAVNTGL